mgnify:CR=1 FL=1
MSYLGKTLRAKGKTCDCQGAQIVEHIGLVIKVIDAANGIWLMMDTPNGTKTVKEADVIEVY